MTEHIGSNSDNSNWILNSGPKLTINVSGDDILRLLDGIEKLTVSVQNDVNVVYNRNVSKQQEQKLNKVNSMENTLNNDRGIDIKTKQI